MTEFHPHRFLDRVAALCAASFQKAEDNSPNDFVRMAQITVYQLSVWRVLV